MSFQKFALALAVAAPAVAQTLEVFSDNKCMTSTPLDPIYYDIPCEVQCTNFDNGVTSVQVSSLEYNQQVWLYEAADCGGDVYTAIGNAYGSGAGIGNCVPSSKDGLKSFQVVTYDNDDGGAACPPGTRTAAPSNFPAPTG